MRFGCCVVKNYLLIVRWLLFVCLRVCYSLLLLGVRCLLFVVVVICGLVLFVAVVICCLLLCVVR